MNDIIDTAVMFFAIWYSTGFNELAKSQCYHIVARY